MHVHMCVTDRQTDRQCAMESRGGSKYLKVLMPVVSIRAAAHTLRTHNSMSRYLRVLQ